ncbi:MAG: aldo/keto reductase [Aggregatilineaceae bacterium]
MALKGHATAEGTAAYAARLQPPCAAGHFRQGPNGLMVSSLGVGTYLGAPDDATDERYQAAIQRALASGVNVIDTAANYRYQRSERAVGQALAAALRTGTVRREEVLIATKGGFVPFDGTPPPDPRRWVYERYIETGLVHPHEFVANYHHCLAPDFLDAMIELSRRNLGVETIDIYYLHNPETQRISNSHQTFRQRMRNAFEALEAAVERGAIACYGVATWSAFRSPPDAPDYLSLTELVGLAFEVAGEGHHFAVVQMPYNLIMAEAYALSNQQLGEEFYSPIEVAQELALTVMASASLKQGTLASPFMVDLSPYFPGLTSDAQRALQFVRSTPGVTTALVGMSDPAHVEENLALATVPPLPPEAIAAMFSPPM